MILRWHCGTSALSRFTRWSGTCRSGKPSPLSTPDAALAGKLHPGNDLVYVRPHWLEIGRHPNGENPFRATVRHINSAGPLVKVEAITEWGGPVHVEMSQERFRDLQLTKNEPVFITPRDVKVFDGRSSD